MKIIQPGVAAIKSRLRRVTDQKSSALKGLPQSHTYCSLNLISYRLNNFRSSF